MASPSYPHLSPFSLSLILPLSPLRSCFLPEFQSSSGSLGQGRGGRQAWLPAAPAGARTCALIAGSPQCSRPPHRASTPPHAASRCRHRALVVSIEPVHSRCNSFTQVAHPPNKSALRCVCFSTLLFLELILFYFHGVSGFEWRDARAGAR